MPRPRLPPDETRAAVARLLLENLSRAEIARRLEISKSTVTFHATRLGIPADQRSRRRYDWAAVQRFYDEGHSLSDCQAEFGMARATLLAASRRGELVTRPQAMPIDELLASRSRSRSHLKGRLLKAGLLEERCYRCGIREWHGQRLPFELHHINGDGKDNRLENLEIRCPNCHAQTETWGGRNRRRSGARSRAA